MKNILKKPKINIGIPTYEAGDSLISVLKSIYNQTYFKYLEFIVVVVDGNKIKKNIIEKIRNPKLKIIYYKKRKGQSARINSIFKNMENEFIVLTNDDVILKKNAIEELFNKHKRTHADLIAGNAKPVEETKTLAKIISIGNKISNSISLFWNKGGNYLACNGRLLGISKSLYTKLSIPEAIWNNDMYIYLYVRENNFKFAFAENAVCFYKSPENLREHVSQSLKYQKSYDEMQKYFKSYLSEIYEIPLAVKIKAVKKVFFQNPLFVILYFLLYYYTRVISILNNKPMKDKIYWETDISTKKI